MSHEAKDETGEACGGAQRNAEACHRSTEAMGQEELLRPQRISVGRMVVVHGVRKDMDGTPVHGSRRKRRRKNRLPILPGQAGGEEEPEEA